MANPTGGGGRVLVYLTLSAPKATGRLRRRGVCLERDGRASSGPYEVVRDNLATLLATAASPIGGMPHGLPPQRLS